jgi:DNA-binding NarL/FixJ family response regulator
MKVVENLVEGTCEVVGSLPNGRSLFDAAMILKPDIIITDISMPILNGIEAVNELHGAGSTSKIIFLTVHSDPDFLTSCTRYPRSDRRAHLHFSTVHETVVDLNACGGPACSDSYKSSLRTININNKEAASPPSLGRAKRHPQ